MSEFFITWILWAILGTTDPNVSLFYVLDEFNEQKQCLEIARNAAPALADDLAKKGATWIDSVTMACLPVMTRTTTDANKPLLQPLPRKNYQRTTAG